MLTAIALMAAHVPDPPRITCVGDGPRIVVRFFDDPVGPESVIDKFAVVQSWSILDSEWRFVVDTDARPPIRFSPFKPSTRRLVIDTRRQLAVIWSRQTGKARIVPAFPRAGRYILVFSDNLVTEVQNMDDWECRVRVRQGAEAEPRARVEGPRARR